MNKSLSNLSKLNIHHLLKLCLLPLALSVSVGAPSQAKALPSDVEVIIIPPQQPFYTEKTQANYPGYEFEQPANGTLLVDSTGFDKMSHNLESWQTSTPNLSDSSDSNEVLMWTENNPSETDLLYEADIF